MTATNQQPVAEICSASHDDAQFGERAIKPLCDISGFEYGTPLYAGAAPAAVAGPAIDRAATLAAIDDISEPSWTGYECPNTWADGLSAARAVVQSAPAAPALEAPAAPACPYTGFAARYWTLGYQGHDCPPTTGPVSREAYDAGARARLAAAPQAPAAPSGLPWRTGIPPWTDDRAVRVIAVTAHDDFGGVQVHDIRASDFHTDGDGDGAEVARVCTHWAYRDDIWPRADAAAPAAPAVDAKAHDWRENASYGGEICAECGAAKGSRRGNAPCAWPPEPLDVCTDPYNCARCKTHPAHRGDMHHAGISRIGGSA